MAETVGQHAISTFTTPAASAALSSSVVRGNFNTVKDAYVAHDEDPGIHMQSSTLVARPAAGTAGRKWLTNDSGSVKIWYDTGSVWDEVDYLSATGTSAVAGDLTVAGNTTLGDATTDTITLTARFISHLIPLANNLRDIGTSLLKFKDGWFAGTVTATTFDGSLDATNLTGTAAAINGSAITALNGSNIASGTVGNAYLPAAISVTTLEASSTATADGFIQAGGSSYTERTTSSGTNFTVDCSLTNWHKHTLTGNGTMTISNLHSGQGVVVVVENTGAYTLAFSGVTSWDNGDVTPTQTAIASRKDVYGFLGDSTDVLGCVIGQNWVAGA